MNGKRIVAFLMMVVMVFIMLPIQVKAYGNLYLNLDSNYEGGSAISIPISTYDYTLSLTGTEFTRQGYTIIGWAESPTGNIKYQNGQSFTVTEGMTLYAVWQKDGACTISYYSSDGTLIATDSHASGMYDLLNISVPNCYFNGWAKTLNGEKIYKPCERIDLIDDMDLYVVETGQSLISDIPPVSDGGYVYAGGIKWRVIGSDDDKALLISAGTVAAGKAWDEALGYCTSLYEANSFSVAEKAAICSTSKSDDVAYSIFGAANLSDAKLFLLSASEAETYFAGNGDRKNGCEATWWLRSPHFDNNFTGGRVKFDGSVWDDDVSRKLDVRPAFVLNLESVLFSSAAEGGKSSAAADSGFGNFLDGGTEAKKLTLLDSSRSGFTANVGGSSSVTVASADTVGIFYSGAGTESGEYVSAMLCNSDGDIIGYASVATDSDGEDIWLLTLPSDLTDGATYTLKVFSEQQNGNNSTDYASQMIPITLTVGDVQLTKENTPNATFTATGSDSGTLSDVSADMKYSIDGGTNWTSITETSVMISSGVTATNGIKVYKPGNGTTTSDSDVQTITITKASKPAGLSKTDCTTAANNNGTISGVTASMEYRKSDASAWTAGTGDVISALSNGTYYIRTKASGTTLASDDLELIISTYNAPGQVDNPTFSPTDGTYTETQSVTISCSTAGAEIYYTTDGSIPTSSSTKYTEAIPVTSTTTIKAIAVKDGMTDSTVVTATYTIEAQTPIEYVVNVTNGMGSGNYAAGIAVTITANDPASGMVFDKWTSSDGVNFADESSATTTFIMPAKTVSVTATYKAVESVATPVYSPAGGTYSSAQSVTISCATSGSAIYYTTDGSTPTSSSTKYIGTISVTSTTTIKAIALKDGMANSEVATATYTISNGNGGSGDLGNGGNSGTNSGNTENNGDSGNTGNNNDPGNNSENTGNNNDPGNNSENTGNNNDSGNNSENTGNNNDPGNNSENTGNNNDSGNNSENTGNNNDPGNNSGNTGNQSDSGNTAENPGNSEVPTQAPVNYTDVSVSTDTVRDITGIKEATGETNPFGAKIVNGSELASLLSLTQAEITQGVNVWLYVKDMSDTVSQADKTVISDASGDYIVSMYFDINLFKKVGNNDAVKVTETNGKVKVSILVPENLWKEGRTFEIIRVHNGVATVIKGIYDEMTHIFTFETDEFSTYAVAYKDKDNSSTGDTGNAGNNDNSTEVTAPKTGDVNETKVWYLLILAALSGLCLLVLSEKKKSEV